MEQQRERSVTQTPFVVTSVEDLQTKKHPPFPIGAVKFSSEMVIILDLNGTNIALKDLYESSEIKDLLSRLHQSGIALCIVTNNTILDPNNALNPNASKAISSLSAAYPGYFDLLLYDPSNPTSDRQKRVNKKKMLDACKTVYPGTVFSYIGFNPAILDDAKSINISPYHIHHGKQVDKVPIQPSVKVNQQVHEYQAELSAYEQKLQQCKTTQFGLFTLALKKAQREIIEKKNSLSGVQDNATIHSTAVDNTVVSLGAQVNTNNIETAGTAPLTHGLNTAGGRLPRRPPSPPLITQPQQPAPKPPAPSGDNLRPPRTRKFQIGDQTVVGQTYFPDPSERTAPSRNNQRDALDIQLAEDSSEDLLLKPATTTATLPFKQWLKQYFLKSPLISDTPITDKSSLITFIKNSFFAPFKALILIYGFDGYDPITNEISYAHGADKPEQYVQNSITDFSPKLFLASFLGLPSRPIKGRYGPTITFKQIARNFLGGIDWKDAPTHKKRLQAAGFLIKGLLIPAVKVITWPFKVIINGFKLATEVAPWLATTLTYFLYRALAFGTQSSWLAMKMVASGGSDYRDEGNVLKKGLGWLAIPATIGLFLLSVALALSTAALFVAHYACRVLMVVGRAITSPEKSLRMAYAYGSELKLPFASERVQRGFARVIGVFGAAISLAITAVTWAICFPLIINFIVNFMPPIASLATAFLNWQPVVNTLTAAQGTVGAFLHSTFGPAIVGLTNFIGVQITYSAIIASIASLFVIPLTTLGDYLSNRWANWHEGGIFDLKSKKGGSSGLSSDAAPSDSDRPSRQRRQQSQPSRNLVYEADSRFVEAQQSDKIADLRSRTPPVPQSTYSRPAPSARSQEEVQAVKSKYQSKKQ